MDVFRKCSDCEVFCTCQLMTTGSQLLMMAIASGNQAGKNDIALHIACRSTRSLRKCDIREGPLSRTVPSRRKMLIGSRRASEPLTPAPNTAWLDPRRPGDPQRKPEDTTFYRQFF